MVEAEGAVVDPEALRLVSRYAAGSLRDAQNLLEQLVVSSGDEVGLHQVEDLLGLGHGERWLDLVKYLLMGNASASLGVINQAAWDGTDLRQFHRQTLELLRAVLHLQWSSGESLDLADHVVGQLRELVGQLPPWRIVKALRTWGEVNMRYDAPSTLPLELAAVEICEAQAVPSTGPANGPAEQPAAAPVTTRPPPARQATESPRPAPPIRTEVKESKPKTPVAPVAQRAPSEPTPAQPSDALSSETTTAQPSDAPPSEPAPTTAPAAADGDLAGAWTATVKALARHKGKRYILGALLKDCRPDAIYLEGGDTLCLAFAHRTHLERMQEEMEDPRGRRLVSEVIGQCFGKTYEFKLTLIESNGEGGASSRSAQNSPLVRAAMGMGARIIEEVVE
jgi:DNA polymerase-3 subunit gamma/tau